VIEILRVEGGEGCCLDATGMGTISEKIIAGGSEVPTRTSRRRTGDREA
jgi:hypothetical protein